MKVTLKASNVASQSFVTDRLRLTTTSGDTVESYADTTTVTDLPGGGTRIDIRHGDGSSTTITREPAAGNGSSTTTVHTDDGQGNTTTTSTTTNSDGTKTTTVTTTP